MDDLRRRFASLDRVPAPDLWNTIELRVAASGSVERVTRFGTPTPLASPRSTSRSPWVYLAAAAVLLTLIVGALAVGSYLVRLPAVLPIEPAPAPSVVALPSATEMASPSPAASTAGRTWITGRELMDALSAEHGYEWSPLVVNGSTGFKSGPIDRLPRVDILAPIDGPARVRVAGTVDATAEVEQHAGRVARLLAPDVAPWIQDVIAQGLDALAQGLDAGDPLVTEYADSRYRVSTTLTAGGDEVGVTFVDEELMGDWVEVVFTPDPPDPPPTRVLETGASGIVLYTVHGGEDPSDPSGDRIWAVNPDGTDAGLFIPSTTTPDGVGDVLGWSADGSRLFFHAGGGVFAVDADGSPAFRVGAARDNPLCPVVAAEDCEANEDIAISPDGTRIAYTLSEGSGLETPSIAILDVASGQVTRLAFDSEGSPGGPACAGPFGGGPLQWSPDGTRLAFGNSVGPKVDGWCQGALFTINVDGTDLRRLTPSTVHAMDPRWSPDGSTIVFSTSTPRSAWDRKTDATRIPIDMDIYSVRPDGSGLTALTSDGVSIEPLWTRDGRIVFTRHVHPEATGELWIMDADGENATRLDTTVAAQTAAGCLVCPDPDGDGYRFWQPMPEGQP